MRRIFLAAMVGTALAPLPATLASAQSTDNCGQLVAFIQQNQGARFTTTMEQARAMQAKKDERGCQRAFEQAKAEAGGNQPANQSQQQSQAEQDQQGDIVVQQPAPTVTVDQATPEVSVQQTQPKVTVRQPQPQIAIHQPAPVVTIEIPQPEVTVRMPRPEVSVEQTPPQVAVQQPKPRVRVVQPEQPQVQVEQGEQAQVALAPLEGQANVQLEQAGHTQITYDREEPKVTINQPKGQPRVRIEQADQQQASASSGTGEQQSSTTAETGQQQASASSGEMTTGSVRSGADVGAAANGETQQIAASDVKDMTVVNTKGEQIGKAEGLVKNVKDNKLYLLIRQDGFLGIDKKQIALLTDDLVLQGDRIVVPNASNDDIKAFPAFEPSDQYTQVQGSETATIKTAAR